MKLFSILLLIGISLKIPAVTHAAERIEVVTESWEPYSYLLPDGSVGGTSTEKVRRILDKAGLEYDISIYHWARAYRTALSKKNVLIYSIYRTKERESKFQWLCPFLPTRQIHAYALAERGDINIGKLADLKQYLIGMARDEYVYQYLIEHGFEEHKHTDINTTYNTGLHKLVSKRIDLIIGTREAIHIRLKALGYGNTQLTAVYEIDTAVVTGNCMAFSLTTSPEVVEKSQAGPVRHQPAY
ncbi:transporter substrate-binding domain-containing protein [Thalassomonas viridans]|uniref:Transporter substrate-binding domain-containing protein n=1 Tax=Thalassomonas viridans TaxID=137584 RepID=A0AAE9ZDV6_9GAMM|nr:transporter substrate-binding domain-containing protein [Thalassomonas viridans]WDE08918.1 transporter substrate-binding domain-containing protein [Thalassomonas viridans]